MLRTARKQANLSQEEAAFRLHIGRRTLVDYENGNTPVPPDVIHGMAEVYGQPLLRIMYCTDTCPLGGIHDKLEEYDVPTLLIGMISGIQELNTAVLKLAKIFSDARLDKHELPEYGEAKEVLRWWKKRIATLEAKVAMQIPQTVSCVS